MNWTGVGLAALTASFLVPNREEKRAAYAIAFVVCFGRSTNVGKPMITICHPVDDLELMFLRAALEAADIPHFVVGQHFGSLYPGMQIPSYNERSVRVPPGYAGKALKVIEQVRSTYSPAFENLAMKSKLRMLLEGLCLGWVIPAGTKKPSTISAKPGRDRRPRRY